MLGSGDEGTENYANALKVLQSASASSLKGATLYTLAQSDTGWVFEVEDEKTSSLLDGSSHSTKLTKDEWGVWLSSFALVEGARYPIIVGGDISAATIVERERKILYQALSIFLVGAILVALGVYLFMGRSLRRDLGHALRAVAALGWGDFRLDSAPVSKDELGAMAVAIRSLSSDLIQVMGAEQVDWGMSSSNCVCRNAWRR